MCNADVEDTQMDDHKNNQHADENQTSDTPSTPPPPSA